MSDVAAMGGFETTVGLMPRYLRNRDADGSARNVEQAPAAPVAEPSAAEEPRLPGMKGISLTDELRKRIGEVSAPEKHGPYRLWFGVAAVAVIALVCILFPDAIAALLPDVDTSL
jgi:hypothetical protein